MKDGSNLINFDEWKSMGTCCTALYVNGDNETYFDSFVVENIKEN